MNKNKGIIGIGFILAIVLGIIVVGGGAYYLGTKKSIKLVENNSHEVSAGPYGTEADYVAPAPITTTCTSTSVPSLKVVSPNGGEAYTAGQKITVKWDSCNFPSNAKGVNITVAWKGNLEALSFPIANGTPNDGQELITLPSQEKIKDFYNNKFVVHVQMNIVGQDLTVNGDDSDNSFTINASTKTISTTNWKTYTNTEYGFSFKYPSNWDTPSGLFNGKIFEVYSKESITVPFINYHPSNNKLTMNDFVGTSGGHDATDIPVKISVAGQNASKFTYETATNGRGQPYPLFNQQVGFGDHKGGFFVINFAVPPTEKENGINLFNQILSSFTLQ